VRIAPRVLGPRDTDHELLWTAVAATSGALAWAAFAAHAPLPACAVKTLTGWPCLTCGGTRAIAALLAFDVMAAARLNPLVTFVVAAWTAYAIYGVGAMAGAWSRLRVELDAREGRALRACAVLGALATWAFLIVDGR
jgi:hypothetical protein